MGSGVRRCVADPPCTGDPVIRMWGSVYYCRDHALSKGGITGRRAVALYDIEQSGDGFTPAVLRRLAEGGLMDANALFLPAGKVSAEEVAKREWVRPE